MLSERTGQMPEATRGLPPKAGGAGSSKSGGGVYWTTGDMMNETKLAGAVCPVGRNRRIRNRTYGGVGGRRGRPRLLPDNRGLGGPLQASAVWTSRLVESTAIYGRPLRSFLRHTDVSFARRWSSGRRRSLASGALTHPILVAPRANTVPRRRSRRRTRLSASESGLAIRI